MVASIDQMLGVTYTAKAISRVAAASSAITRKFGMQGGPPGSNIRGKNVTTIGHRQFGYDIFNDSRAVGRSTVPGAPAAVSARNPVGRVQGTFPRMHDSIPLAAEELHNRRVIGGNSSAYDEGGKNYIARQQKFLGQKAGNFRTMLVGGMIRGAVYGHQVSADRIYYDYTSTSAVWTIDYQIPSGNKTQLNMLGAGNILDVAWDNPGANIPKHIGSVNAAFQQLVGSRCDLMIMNATTWNYVMNNDYVIQNAGSSNPAFIELSRETGTSENGRPYTTIEARIAAVPWVTILITDEGLDLENSGGTTTYTKFLPDGAVWFGPNPDPMYFEMLEGGEPISEGPNMAPVIKNGLDAWTYNSWNPTATVMYALDNAMPALYVPSACAYATVTGF